MFELCDHLIDRLSCRPNRFIYSSIHSPEWPLGVREWPGECSIKTNRSFDIFTHCLLCSTGRGSERQTDHPVCQLYGTVAGGACLVAGTRASATAAATAAWSIQARCEARVLR